MDDPETTEQPVLEVYLREYEKLKEEQTSRIGFRDNLLYVTLTLFGALVAFALSNPDFIHGLLVLPWVCLILGWNYLANDEKISAIGRYIRNDLTNKVNEMLEPPHKGTTFGWEIAHRSDPRRGRRKIEQLMIDLIAFVLSGLTAVVLYLLLAPQLPAAIWIVALIDIILLTILGMEIFVYADLAKGR